MPGRDSSRNQSEFSWRCFPVISSLLVTIGLGACAQLPSRSDGVPVNQVPSLDPTVISSNNGLLSAGISIVPGSYCIPGQSGKCDPQSLSPAQCLAAGAIVDVSPKTNPTPAYHSLIDNRYSGAANVPFISATTGIQYLDEITATVVATAQFAVTSPNNGYPGIEGLKQCILRNQGPGSYGTVYWIASANVITVSRDRYKQVSNSAAVTATAFGANGSTYDHDGVSQQEVYIGLQAAPINVGIVSAPPGSPISPAARLSQTPHGYAIKWVAQPEILPSTTKNSFISP